MSEDVKVGCALVAIVAFVLGGISLFFEVTRFSRIGEGQHRGYVTAVDERGYIWRNYDVYFKTEAEASQEDRYCIHRANRELIDRAKELNQSRELVTIHYRGVRGIGFGLCLPAEILEIE